MRWYRLNLGVVLRERVYHAHESMYYTWYDGYPLDVRSKLLIHHLIDICHIIRKHVLSGAYNNLSCYVGVRTPITGRRYPKHYKSNSLPISSKFINIVVHLLVCLSWLHLIATIRYHLTLFFFSFLFSPSFSWFFFICSRLSSTPFDPNYMSFFVLGVELWPII